METALLRIEHALLEVSILRKYCERLDNKNKVVNDWILDKLSFSVIAAWNAENYGSEVTKRMGESSPQLHRTQEDKQAGNAHHTTHFNHTRTQNISCGFQFLLPSRRLESSRSSDNVHRILRERECARRGDTDDKDCFSSTEYVAYMDRKASEENIRGRERCPFIICMFSNSFFSVHFPSVDQSDIFEYF